MGYASIAYRNRFKIVAAPPSSPPGSSLVRTAPNASWAYMFVAMPVPESVPSEIPASVLPAFHQHYELFASRVTETPGYASASGTLAVVNGSAIITGTGANIGKGAFSVGRGIHILDTAAGKWRPFVIRSVNHGAQTAVLGVPNPDDEATPTQVNWPGTTQSELPFELHTGYVTASSGSLAVTNGSATIAGSGALIGSNGFAEDEMIGILDVAAETWRYFTISSVDAETQTAVLSAPWTGSSQSGLSFQLHNGPVNARDRTVDDEWGDPGDNYYDRVYWLYMAWACFDNFDPDSPRLAAARAMIDHLLICKRMGNLQYDLNGIAQGWITSGARTASLMGIICRALDGRPELWPHIVAYAEQYMHAIWLYRNREGGPLEDQLISARDAGYSLSAIATIGAVHPDSEVRATFEGYAKARAIDTILRAPNLITIASDPLRTRLASPQQFDLDDDGQYDSTPDTQTGCYGGGGTYPSQQFLDVHTIRGLARTFLTMRKSGAHITEAETYDAIIAGFLALVRGWKAGYVSNADRPGIRGFGYFTGLATHYVATEPVEGGASVSGTPFFTPAGAPAGFGVSETGTSEGTTEQDYTNAYDARGLMADGVALLGLAHVLEPDAGHDAFFYDAMHAMFDAVRPGAGLEAVGGDGKYSLYQVTHNNEAGATVYALQPKLSNQHFGAGEIMQGVGLLMLNALPDFAEAA